MKEFYSLLCFMGMSTVWCEDDLGSSLDIIGKLPPEIAIQILRLLDSNTLVVAALVNKYWLSLCRMDSILRERVRKYLCRERHRHIESLLYGSSLAVLRDVGDGSVNISQAFTRRNDRFKIVAINNQGNATTHSRPASTQAFEINARSSFVQRTTTSSQGAGPSFPLAYQVESGLRHQSKHSSASARCSKTSRRKKTSPYDKTVRLRL